ncbi:MAG: phage holin family protein [Actinomycetales bacterium]|nr:phage holin family protein [Actinomycetales bacterium]
MSERGFFSRITEPITERVREGVDNVEEKVKGAIQAQTDKVKAAAQAKAEEYGRSVVSFGVAGVLGWLGILSLVAAAILGLSEVLHPALAAVVVSAVLFLVAGLLGLYGKSNLPKSPEPAAPGPVTPALRQQDESVDHFWTD